MVLVMLGQDYYYCYTHQKRSLLFKSGTHGELGRQEGVFVV